MKSAVVFLQCTCFLDISEKKLFCPCNVVLTISSVPVGANCQTISLIHHSTLSTALALEQANKSWKVSWTVEFCSHFSQIQQQPKKSILLTWYKLYKENEWLFYPLKLQLSLVLSCVITKSNLVSFYFNL